MDTYSVRNRPLAATIVFAAVIVAIFALSYAALLAVAGNDVYEGSSMGTSEASNLVEAIEPEPVAVAVPVPLPEPVFVSADGEVQEPDAGHDCDAFFTELDTAHDANTQRFAEVLDSFDIANELIADEAFVYVDVDHTDPIVEAISTSFWTQIAEQDEDTYGHECFGEEHFEGCEEGEETDYHMTEEQKAAIQADWTEENEALAKAFTEAGINFAWETDEYFELDVVTFDYDDDAAMAVYSTVFTELNPELAHDEEANEFYAYEMEQFEAESQAREAVLVEFADALAEAGVDHEITNEYDWMMVTFDLDDDRAIPIVAAFR